MPISLAIVSTQFGAGYSADSDVVNKKVFEYKRVEELSQLEAEGIGFLESRNRTVIVYPSDFFDMTKESPYFEAANFTLTPRASLRAIDTVRKHSKIPRSSFTARVLPVVSYGRKYLYILISTFEYEFRNDISLLSFPLSTSYDPSQNFLAIYDVSEKSVFHDFEGNSTESLRKFFNRKRQ